jgi:hypothetical protein
MLRDKDGRPIKKPRPPFNLQAIVKRLEKATDGPWGAFPNALKLPAAFSGCQVHVIEYGTPKDNGGFWIVDRWLGQKSRMGDLQFVAHARQDVQDLVAEVQRLRAKLDLLEQRG